MLIETKAKAFLEAEKTYWEQIQSLRQQLHDTEQAFGLGLEHAMPQDIASTVWGLKDGVAFVRHKSVRGERGVSFRVLLWTLEEWAEKGPVLPLEGGDFLFGQSSIKLGLSTGMLVDCQVGEISIPYAEFSHMRYDDTANEPSIERAILDFQLCYIWCANAACGPAG